MNKTKNMIQPFIMSLIFVFFSSIALTGCGSSAKSEAEEYYRTDAEEYGDSFTGAMAEEAAYDMADSEMINGDGDGGGLSSEVTGDNVQNSSGKIVRNANVSLRVDDLYAFSDNLSQLVQQYGGYVENADVHDYEYDYSSSRSGYFTVRVPADKLDDFMSNIEGKGTVLSKSESAEDVTLQYVDIEAHIASYEAERESIEALLEKADKIEDIITIREHLTEINYELDSLKRQLRSMDNKIAYSTVSVSATQERTIETRSKSFGSRLWENFVSDFADGWETALEMILYVITRLPVIIVLLIFLFIGIKVLVFFKDRFIGSPEKRAERAAKKKARAEKKKAESEARRQGKNLTDVVAAVRPEDGEKNKSQDDIASSDAGEPVEQENATNDKQETKSE